MLEDYDSLERLTSTLPENHKLLPVSQMLRFESSQQIALWHSALCQYFEIINMYLYVKYEVSDIWLLFFCLHVLGHWTDVCHCGYV